MYLYYFCRALNYWILWYHMWLKLRSFLVDLKKKHNKNKGHSITFSYIWWYIKMCVLTKKLHILWKTTPICATKLKCCSFLSCIFQSSVVDLPRKMVSKIKNQAPLRSTTIIYLTFSKFSRPLHKLDRHFLELTETYTWSIWV